MTAKKRRKRKRSKAGFAKKILILFALVIVGTGAFVFIDYYDRVYSPNVNAAVAEGGYFYIKTGAEYKDVAASLARNGFIVKQTSFEWVADMMNYKNNVYPGRYKIKPGMSNRKIVSMLRSGNQIPLSVTINRVRTKNELVPLIAHKLEADSAELHALLEDEVFLRKYGFTEDDVIANFIPDTYEFNWNTSARDFFERMHAEYDNFWTGERKEKAKMLNLTPVEAVTLASIVEEETNKNDEKSRIAGVYLNRLNKGWKLQADPTIKFAIQRFELQRVLKEHTTFDSPYNTYLYEGLPPGPIRTPARSTIIAVLNPEKHDYMYFCARDDFSGYHNFATTLSQHLQNARKFQRELNRRRIL